MRRWILASLLGLGGVCWSSGAAAQCLGFDRFPIQQPQSVVAKGFQKAYIYHVNGVERIVLQPSYSGVAKDFGVFLAVPEIPIIEKVDEKLFTELEQLTQTQALVGDIQVTNTRAMEEDDSWRGVSVIQQELVGIYEATVLQASDRKSFTDWLQANGYFWPKEIEPIFDGYVEADWFFVAMKVNRNVDTEAQFSGPIQPISVRFTQDEIVMPMKLTSLTPGGVDFAYYLITDTNIRAKSIRQDLMLYNSPLMSTFSPQQYPTLNALLKKDTLRTRQDDLRDILSKEGMSKEQIAEVQAGITQPLWLTKYQGHFNRADLGEDFVWTPLGERQTIDQTLASVNDTRARDAAVAAYNNGMRQISRVRLIADVYDTNLGYGKPTFINGIHVGDLAAIGGEGSDQWKTIEMELPHSVVRWLGDKVTVKVENYGKNFPGKGRFSDAYNIKNVRIVVDYDNNTDLTKQAPSGTICSVPEWDNCQGTPVSRWGEPVIIKL